MKRVDTGFIGSIIMLWIKHAHAVKSFLSKHIFSIGKNIAVKSASISIMVGKAVSSILSTKKILLLSRKVLSHGIKDYFLMRKLLIGKEIVSVIGVYIVGLNHVKESLRNVSYVIQLRLRGLIGQIRAVFINVNFQTGNVFV